MLQGQSGSLGNRYSRAIRPSFQNIWRSGDYTGKASEVKGCVKVHQCICEHVTGVVRRLLWKKMSSKTHPKGLLKRSVNAQVLNFLGVNTSTTVSAQWICFQVPINPLTKKIIYICRYVDPSYLIAPTCCAWRYTFVNFPSMQSLIPQADSALIPFQPVPLNSTYMWNDNSSQSV